jgi:phosphate transport system substrate-binding protein
MQSIYRVLSILILGWISLSSHAVENHLIVGRGSTFASDALNSWSESYYKITGLKLDFQEDDSARIIEKLKNGSIQFIATDIPMSAVDLKLNGFVQFPIVVGAVAPVIGIKGLNSGY